MKKTIFLGSIVLITSVILFSINYSLSSKENENKSVTNIQTSDPDEFLVGAYHVGCASNNSNPMQELGLNIWHRFIINSDDNLDPNYNQPFFPRGELVEDKLMSDVSLYQGSVVNYYNSKSGLNNNYLYLNSPKIEMLSFAQRSDYHPFALNYHQPSD
jgi:hypothetical protein